MTRIGRFLLYRVILLWRALIFVEHVLIYAVVGAGIAIRGVVLAGLLVIRLLFAGFIWLPSRYRTGAIAPMAKLVLFMVRYAALWTVIWWLQWKGLTGFWENAPYWLIDSASGVQTALQVLPAAVIAILVLLLGSLFVVAQLLISSYGSRAPVMLTFDHQVQEAIVRPLLIAAATFFLAALVPESGTPDAWLAAAVTTVILASVATLAQSAALWPGVLLRYTLPRGFAQHVVEDIGEQLEDGNTGFVLMRIGLLGEMLKIALSRRDSVTVAMTLEAIRDLEDAYLAALPNAPQIRGHVLESGAVRSHWCGEEIATALVSGGQAGLAQLAPETDAQEIGNLLGSAASRFVSHDEIEDAHPCIDGLGSLATSAHQVTVGAVNLFPQPTEALSQVEVDAETASSDEAATEALAHWAMAVTYPMTHFEFPGHLTPPHPHDHGFSSNHVERLTSSKSQSRKARTLGRWDVSAG